MESSHPHSKALYQATWFGTPASDTLVFGNSAAWSLADHQFGWLINFGDAVSLEIEGHVHTLPGGGFHAFKRGPKSPIRVSAKPQRKSLFVCLLQNDFSHRAFQQLTAKIDPHCLLGLQPRFRARSQRRAMQFRQTREDQPLRRSAILHEWLTEFEWGLFELRQTYEVFCQSLPHQLVHHPQPAPTLEELAKRLGLTHFQLSSLLKLRWGCSPGKALRLLKRHQAARMLLSTSMSIESVAAATGYASRSAFARSFRGEFGMTPTQFRKRGAVEEPEERMKRKLYPKAADGPHEPFAGTSPLKEAPPHYFNANSATFRFFHAQHIKRYRNFGRKRMPFGSNFFHPLCEWFVFLQGERYLEFGNKRVLLKPGSVLAARQGFSFHWRVEKDEEEAFLLFIAWPPGIAEIQSATCAAHGWITHLEPHHPFIEYSIDMAAKLSRCLRLSSGEASRTRQSKLTYRWLCQWQKAVENARPGQREPIDLPERALLLSPERIKKAITSIKSYADVLGYSPSHTSRLLRAGHDKPSGKRLREARLLKARSLLLDTDDSVESIAQQCGYSKAFALIRPFKKLFGQTPHAFRIANRL